MRTGLNNSPTLYGGIDGPVGQNYKQMAQVEGSSYCGTGGYGKVTTFETGVHSVSVILESLQEQVRLCYVEVYGPHTATEREELWYELASIRGIWDGHWVVEAISTCADLTTKSYSAVEGLEIWKASQTPY